jgi:hypothetical protein
MKAIKVKGNRYYIWYPGQMRSFPIKKVEALELLANGEAELVDRFFWEPSEEVEASVEVVETVETVNEAPVQNVTVIDFAARKAQKEEKQQIDQAIEFFMSEILPSMNVDEMSKIMTATSRDELKAEIMRAYTRIKIQRMFGV